MVVSKGTYSEIEPGKDPYRIDTFIPGNPEQCRETADSLEKQGERFADAAGTVIGARGDIVSVWQGKAGQACAAHIAKWIPVGGTVHGAINELAQGLRGYADGIADAKGTMKQVVAAAHDGGLGYDGRYVSMTPDNAPADGSGIERREKFWNEACQSHGIAQGQRRAAEDRLKRACGLSHEQLQNFAGTALATVAQAVTFAGRVNETSEAYARAAHAPARNRLRQPQGDPAEQAAVTANAR